MLGEIDELKPSLEKESVGIERVFERLLDHISARAAYPLMERSSWGSGVHLYELQHVTAAPLA